MRIAVFTDIYAPWATGGIVSSIQAQKRELEKLGHTVVVFCPGFDSDDPTVVTVPTFKRLKINETAVARTPQEIETAILDQRPEFGREFDLVHAHYEAACSIAGIRLARRFGLPVVQTMHGREDMAIAVNVAPALRFGVAEALDLLHAQCLEHGVEVERDQFQAPTLTRARMWRLMVNHAESADIVVTPTRHFAEKLRHYGVTRPLRVVSNGVDEDLVTQEFQVRRLEEGAPLLMLWNSRVSHEKRIMPFLKAVAQLQRPRRVGDLSNELHACALMNFAAHDRGLNLAIFAVAQISDGSDARLIFIAQGQVQHEVPVAHKSKFGKALGQRSEFLTLFVTKGATFSCLLVSGFSVVCSNGHGG